MTAIFEERLFFEFGTSWRVEKYDEHPSFKEGIERLKEELSCDHCRRPAGVGTKAVDIVGRRAGDDSLYLIEIKDFRGHEVENRRRMREALAIEVAVKVRDTLAALVGAHHVKREPSLRDLAPQTLRGSPKVLLWLEQDAVRMEQRGDPTIELRRRSTEASMAGSARHGREHGQSPAGARSHRSQPAQPRLCGEVPPQATRRQHLLRTAPSRLGRHHAGHRRRAHEALRSRVPAAYFERC